MRPRTLMVGLALVLVLGATTAVSLRRVAPAAAQPGPMAPGNLAQLSGDALDQAWLQMMIMHQMMAVMIAQPAAAGAPHEELRAFVGTVTADQTREIAQMRDWLGEWYGVTLPDPAAMMAAMHAGQTTGMMGHDPAMPMAAAAMPHGGMAGPGMGAADMDVLEHLAMLPAPRLEALFLVLMVAHEQHTIEMAQLALDRAAHDELKALAQAIIAARSAEVEQLNRWLADWYGL